MEKYEYMTFEYEIKISWGNPLVNPAELKNQLNIFGKDGWEMVSSTPITELQGRIRSIVYTFKRKIG